MGVAQGRPWPAGKLQPQAPPAGAFVGKRGLHRSHQLLVHRGLWWCASCGEYTSGAEGGPRLLTTHCKPKTRAGKQNLTRLAKGLPPTEDVEWPLPAGVPASKRKAEDLLEDQLAAVPRRRLRAKTTLSLSSLDAGLDIAELDEDLDAEALEEPS